MDSESYLIDHEAETSIKYLALQLLPSPLSPLTWSRPHTSSSLIGFASSSWPSLPTIEIQEQVRRDDAPRVRRPPVFNVTLSVSRVIKVYGEAFAQSIVAQLLAAILIVMHRISAVCNFEEDSDGSKSPSLDRSSTTMSFSGMSAITSWISMR